jgi:hypothetical protein
MNVSLYRARSDALVNFVHQTAADLMEISVKLPRSDEAFQPRREPYWVAPEPAISLLDLTGSVAEGFLPRAIREKRARARIIAEAEKAALRNVANLDWTMRQNIEDSFRRFELSLSNQLDVALKATRQAMQLALQRRTARSEAIKVDIEQANRTAVELSDILAEVEALASTPHSPEKREGTPSC